MRPLPVRLMALFLVPCVIADPATTASLWAAPAPLHRTTLSNPSSELFTSEAFIERALNYLRSYAPLHKSHEIEVLTTSHSVNVFATKPSFSSRVLAFIDSRFFDYASIAVAATALIYVFVQPVNWVKAAVGLAFGAAAMAISRLVEGHSDPLTELAKFGLQTPLSRPIIFAGDIYWSAATETDQNGVFGKLVNDQWVPLVDKASHIVGRVVAWKDALYYLRHTTCAHPGGGSIYSFLRRDSQGSVTEVKLPAGLAPNMETLAATENALYLESLTPFSAGPILEVSASGEVNKLPFPSSAVRGHSVFEVYEGRVLTTSVDSYSNLKVDQYDKTKNTWGPFAVILGHYEAPQFALSPTGELFLLAWRVTDNRKKSGSWVLFSYDKEYRTFVEEPIVLGGISPFYGHSQPALYSGPDGFFITRPNEAILRRNPAGGWQTFSLPERPEGFYHTRGLTVEKGRSYFFNVRDGRWSLYAYALLKEIVPQQVTHTPSQKWVEDLAMGARTVASELPGVVQVMVEKAVDVVLKKGEAAATGYLNQHGQYVINHGVITKYAQLIWAEMKFDIKRILDVLPAQADFSLPNMPLHTYAYDAIIGTIIRWLTEDTQLYSSSMQLLYATRPEDLIEVSELIKTHYLTPHEAYDLISHFLDDDGRKNFLGGRLLDLDGSRRELAEALFKALPEHHPIRQVQTLFPISLGDGRRAAQIEYLRSIVKTHLVAHPEKSDREFENRVAVHLSKMVLENTGQSAVHISVSAGPRSIWHFSINRPLDESAEEAMEVFLASIHIHGISIQDFRPYDSPEEEAATVLDAKSGKIANVRAMPNEDLKKKVIDSITTSNFIIRNLDIAYDFARATRPRQPTSWQRNLFIRGQIKKFLAGNEEGVEVRRDGNVFSVVIPAAMLSTDAGNGRYLTVIPDYLVAEFRSALEQRFPTPPAPKTIARPDLGIVRWDDVDYTKLQRPVLAVVDLSKTGISNGDLDVFAGIPAPLVLIFMKPNYMRGTKDEILREAAWHMASKWHKRVMHAIVADLESGDVSAIEKEVRHLENGDIVILEIFDSAVESRNPEEGLALAKKIVFGKAPSPIFSLLINDDIRAYTERSTNPSARVADLTRCLPSVAGPLAVSAAERFPNRGEEMSAMAALKDAAARTRSQLPLKKLITHEPGARRTARMIDHALRNATRTDLSELRKAAKQVLKNGRAEVLGFLSSIGTVLDEQAIAARTELLTAAYGFVGRARRTFAYMIFHSMMADYLRTKTKVHELVHRSIELTSSDQMAAVLALARSNGRNEDQAAHLIAQYVDDAITVKEETFKQFISGHARSQPILQRLLERQFVDWLSDLDPAERPLAKALFDALPKKHPIRMSYGQVNIIRLLETDIVERERALNGERRRVAPPMENTRIPVESLGFGAMSSRMPIQGTSGRAIKAQKNPLNFVRNVLPGIVLASAWLAPGMDHALLFWGISWGVLIDYFVNEYGHVMAALWKGRDYHIEKWLGVIPHAVHVVGEASALIALAGPVAGAFGGTMLALLAHTLHSPPLFVAALVMVLTNIIAAFPIPKTDGALIWTQPALFAKAA
jgi:hypothetical protein